MKDINKDFALGVAVGAGAVAIINCAFRGMLTLVNDYHLNKHICCNNTPDGGCCKSGNVFGFNDDNDFGNDNDIIFKADDGNDFDDIFNADNDDYDFDDNDFEPSYVSIKPIKKGSKLDKAFKDVIYKNAGKNAVENIENEEDFFDTCDFDDNAEVEVDENELFVEDIDDYDFEDDCND